MLSDPQQRAAYDRYGKGGLSGAPMMDPSTLFSVLFGSDMFEAYVGESCCRRGLVMFHLGPSVSCVGEAPL